MAVFLRFNSFERIISHFQQLAEGVKNAVRDTARILIIRTERLAKKRVRSTTRKPNMGKGNYFRSIKSSFKEEEGSFILKLESNSPVAEIIEFGSRPHIIRAKGNKLLFWPRAKHPVKQIKHPGTPAFRVLGEATEEVGEDTAKIFESVLKRKFN